MTSHQTLGALPRADKASVERCLNEVKQYLGDRFTTNDSVRQSHGQDESWFSAPPPDAVASPASTEEVSAILQSCSNHGVPVIPFGVGTSLEGHVLAVQGGISLDLTNLNEVEEIRVDDLDVTVQAGVTRKALDQELRAHGLFFPVDPGANATIGGMVATGASGTTTVGYGAMRENVLGLEVVLADGRVVRTSRRARKSSAGYDLTRLFLGSEGTLGIITRVWLRVYGIPDRISAAVCQFSSVSEAVRTAIQVLQVGIPVARMELLDESSMRALNRFDESLAEAEAPMLFFEFHGSGGAVTEQAEAVEEIAADNGALSFRASDDQAERSRLWHARHNAYFASLALRPGARAITTDVCVPISRLAECIDATNADIAGTRITSTIVGHVGDGNFHVMMLIDPGAPDEVSAAEAVNERLVKRALSMDGTSTGEHGIGLGKMSFLEDELPGAVEVMQQLKETLDPHWILNPGKIFEAPRPHLAVPKSSASVSDLGAGPDWIIVRVELLSAGGHIFEPPPGRDILISPQHTFRQLSETINAAFARWDLSHLYVFRLGDGRAIGTRVEDPDLLDAQRAKIGSPLREGDTFKYEFDFGDSWEHECSVLKTEVDPEEVYGKRPKGPVAIFGWGTLPDQYGRHSPTD